MIPAAHSPPKERLDSEPHSYADHIEEILHHGIPLLNDMLNFSSVSAGQLEQLKQTVIAAFMLHDMGKLDDENQPVLKGESSDGLKIDHIDAGVAVASEMRNQLLGWLIRGHHSPGLPSVEYEEELSELLDEFSLLEEEVYLRGRRHKRQATNKDPKEYVGPNHLKAHATLIEHTDSKIDYYKQLQIQECGPYPELAVDLPESTLTTRLMLSCLVDADHLSAACYSQGIAMPDYVSPNGRWKERIDKLNEYVCVLEDRAKKPLSKRNQLRSIFYQQSVNSALVNDNIVVCSASVGMGKTTSVLAFQLQQALAHNLRRIFVIAPFTNVINQTVRTLRSAIVLNGEDPEKVVVAHHHKADFTDASMRQYATLWKAPIVVTTAVQFFETLASAMPGQLRKLNSLPGSAIFIDESHACLPASLLRTAWKWLKELSENWGCKVVLSSGSMVEFWKNEYLVDARHFSSLNDLITPETRQEAMELEKSRVDFQREESPLSLEKLVEKVVSTGEVVGHSLKPSVLVIMNTVQSAAVVADALAKLVKQETKRVSLPEMQVLHLSTALSPENRLDILNEIEERNKPNNDWTNKIWYLVATSCVEAGVDLDFAAGLRERASVTSFLQVAGRINRHDIRDHGLLIDFVTLTDSEGLNKHPGFDKSRDVFNQLWSELSDRTCDLSNLSTRSITRELTETDFSEELLESDDECHFQEVMRKFKVINADTGTVIIDTELAKKLELGITVRWQEIQNKSVQLWCSKISKLMEQGHLSPLAGSNSDIYVWNTDYDPKFLGFMSGILQTKSFFEEHGGVF